MDGFTEQNTPGRKGDWCLANIMDTAEEGKCIVTLLSTLLGLTSVSLVGASETDSQPWPASG